MHSATREESHDSKGKGKSYKEQCFNIVQWSKIAVISRYLHKNQPFKSCQQSKTQAGGVSWAGLLPLQPASEEEINTSCLQSCLQWDKNDLWEQQESSKKEKKEVKWVPQLPPKISLAFCSLGEYLIHRKLGRMENSTGSLVWCILLKRKGCVTKRTGQVPGGIKEFVAFSLFSILWILPAETTFSVWEE